MSVMARSRVARVRVVPKATGSVVLVRAVVSTVRGEKRQASQRSEDGRSRRSRKVDPAISRRCGGRWRVVIARGWFEGGRRQNRGSRASTTAAGPAKPQSERTAGGNSLQRRLVAPLTLVVVARRWVREVHATGSRRGGSRGRARNDAWRGSPFARHGTVRVSGSAKCSTEACARGGRGEERTRGSATGVVVAPGRGSPELGSSYRFGAFELVQFVRCDRAQRGHGCRGVWLSVRSWMLWLLLVVRVRVVRGEARRIERWVLVVVMRRQAEREHDGAGGCAGGRALNSTPISVIADVRRGARGGIG